MHQSEGFKCTVVQHRPLPPLPPPPAYNPFYQYQSGNLPNPATKNLRSHPKNPGNTSPTKSHRLHENTQLNTQAHTDKPKRRRIRGRCIYKVALN